MELRKVLCEYKSDVQAGVFAGSILGVVFLLLLLGSAVPYSLSDIAFGISISIPLSYLICSIPSDPREIYSRLVSDVFTSLTLVLMGLCILFFDLWSGVFCIAFALTTWAVRGVKLRRALRNAMPTPGIWE